MCHLEDLLLSFTKFSLLKVMFRSFTDLTYEQIIAVIITRMLRRKIMNSRTKQQDKNLYVSVLINVLGNTKDKKTNQEIWICDLLVLA